MTLWDQIDALAAANHFGTEPPLPMDYPMRHAIVLFHWWREFLAYTGRDYRRPYGRIGTIRNGPNMIKWTA